MADSIDPSLLDLRFDNGDVLIKLSSDPRDWLLLHRKVLSAISPVFNATFKEDWAAPVPVWHPQKQKHVQVWTLILVYDAETTTYFLQMERTKHMQMQGDEALLHALDERFLGTAPPLLKSESRAVLWDVYQKSDHDHHVCECSRSCEWCRKMFLDHQELLQANRRPNKLLCETTWAIMPSQKSFSRRVERECVWDESKGPETVLHMKAFFALIYGISGNQQIHELGLHALCNVISYAEIYLCIPQISEQLQDWLLRCPNIWMIHKTRFPGLRKKPSVVQLAKKLRCGPLLVDIVRQRVASMRGYQNPSRALVAQGLGLSLAELDAMAPEILEQQFNKIKADQDLTDILLRGQFRQISAEVAWLRASPLNTSSADIEQPYHLHLAAMDQWHAHSPYESTMHMAVSNTTSMIVGQWVAAKLHRSRFYLHDYSEHHPYAAHLPCRDPTLGHTASNIEKARREKEPHLLFGEDMIARYVLVSNLNQDKNLLDSTTRMVNTELDRVIEYWAVEIEKWREEHLENIVDEYDPNPPIFRSTEETPENDHYFPYAALYEDKLPWADEEQWTRPAMPQVGQDQASEGFLRELGFVSNTEEMKKDVD